jgi:hypothetical protein
MSVYQLFEQLVLLAALGEAVRLVLPLSIAAFIQLY